MRQVWVSLCFFLISIEGYSGSNITDKILQKNNADEASTTTTITSVIIPHDGSTFDLRHYPNYFVTAEVTHSNSAANISDVRFKVTPPENHGVLVVIHSIILRSGVPIIGTGSKGCFEYIKFSNTVENTQFQNRTAFACGATSDTLHQLVGSRSFLTGINESVNIHIHFSNEEFPISVGMNVNSTKSTFILDITAYSDCSRKFKTSQEEFVCKKGTVCIPAALLCDLNFNCEFDTTLQNSEAQTTKDELNCVKKRETDLNEQTPIMTFPPLFPTSNLPVGTTTSKPFLKFNISSPYWPWNWKKEEKTTTNPTLIIQLYDHGSRDEFLEEKENVSWARQLPFLAVLAIFLSVIFLIFGICSFMAKANTQRPHLFNVTPTPYISNHSPELGQTAHGNTEINIPEDATIYICPFNIPRVVSSSQPPSYEESAAEGPPSYSALFHKQASR